MANILTTRSRVLSFSSLTETVTQSVTDILFGIIRGSLDCHEYRTTDA
jgi:hypothetical protein